MSLLSTKRKFSASLQNVLAHPLVAANPHVASSDRWLLGALKMPKFVAQSLAETTTSEDGRRFELTFVDARGRTQTVSLPTSVAADLAPVLNSLREAADNRPNAKFTKMPKQWAVGTAEHERLVLLKFDDDPPYGLDLKVAENLWREVREETETASLLKAPSVQ